MTERNIAAAMEDFARDRQRIDDNEEWRWPGIIAVNAASSWAMGTSHGPLRLPVTAAAVKPSVGAAGRGRLKHLVRRGAVVWFRRLPPRLVVWWDCGAATADPQFGSSTESMAPCKACDWQALGTRLPRVYYASGADGLIKIGHSTQPGVRALQLKAHLLATEPGDRASESGRHEQFADERQLGEWFLPTPRLVAHIHSLQVAA